MQASERVRAPGLHIVPSAPSSTPSRLEPWTVQMTFDEHEAVLNLGERQTGIRYERPATCQRDLALPRFPNAPYCLSFDTRRLPHLAAQVLSLGEQGGEYLLRAPVDTSSAFAMECFRTHAAICFWQDTEGYEPSWFVYWGVRIWEFAQFFGPYGAVFMRGRGCTGTWSPQKR